MELLPVHSGPPDYHRPDWFCERLTRGEYPAILAQCQELIAERLGLLGPFHPDMAFAHELLSLTQNLMGDRNGALLTNERRLDAARVAFGEHSWQFALSVSDLGASHLFLDRLAQAEPLLTRAAALYDALPREDQNGFVANVGYRSALAIKKKLFSEAERLLVIGIRFAVHDQDWGGLGGLFSRFGAIFLQTDRLLAAERAVRKAIRIYRYWKWTDLTDYAAMLWGLSRVLLRRGDSSTALAECQAALNVYRRALPGGHPTIAAVEQTLAKIAEIVAKNEPVTPS